jgi:hypothetical protein
LLSVDAGRWRIIYAGVPTLTWEEQALRRVEHPDVGSLAGASVVLAAAIQGIWLPSAPLTEVLEALLTLTHRRYSKHIALTEAVPDLDREARAVDRAIALRLARRAS